MNKIRFQFIGTFICFKEVELDSIERPYFQSIANRIYLPLHEAILDPFFYYKLRLDKYQSYQDLSGKSYFGLDVHSFHQIEVFVDGHKKQKFSYFDLNLDNVLFPLYPSVITTIDKPTNKLIIRTKEKGRVNFSFQNEFTVVLDELFTFELTQLNNNLIFTNVIAMHLPLNISKSDTVLIEQFVEVSSKIQ